MRADQDVILSRRQNDIVQFVLIFQVERNQTVAADIGKFLDRCPFNHTVLGDEEQIAVIIVTFVDVNDCLNLLARTNT